MIGVEIFVHAVRMVLNNLVSAVRISGVLMAVQLGVVLLLGTSFLLSGEDVSERMLQGTYPWFGAFLSYLVIVVAGLWIAVAWHRFILREEVPTGPVPPFNGGAIASYFVAGIIFALVLIAVAIPFAIIAGIVMAPIMMAGSGEPGLVAGLIMAAIIYLPVSWVGYRISPILPSAALGERMALKDAWYATGTSGAGFVVLTLVSVAAALLIGLPQSVLPGPLALVWGFLTNWAMMLVGASVLTTIYGHYVERRSLNV